MPTCLILTHEKRTSGGSVSTRSRVIVVGGDYKDADCLASSAISKPGKIDSRLVE
jgi:hypothetical protein